MSDSLKVGPLLWTVFSSILQVFILCFAGWVLARLGIINKPVRRQLNRINISMFTPALLFSKVAFSLTPEKLKGDLFYTFWVLPLTATMPLVLLELWIVPVLFVFITFVSAAVAFLLALPFRLKRSQRNFAIAAAMFNNSNSLPIALMQSLVGTVKSLQWTPDDNPDAMIGRALSYLVVYSTLGMVVRWSYGVRLLAQADDEVPTSDSDSERNNPTDVKAPPQPDEKGTEPPSKSSWQDSQDTASTLVGSEEVLSAARPSRPTHRHPILHSFPNSPISSRVASPNASRLDLPALPALAVLTEHPSMEPTTTPRHRSPPPPPPPPPTFTQRLTKFWKGFNGFMTAPLWAALASLIIACIPPLQDGLNNHFPPVKGAITSAGDCSIPITLLVLGAYFYHPPPPGTDIPRAGGATGPPEASRWQRIVAATKSKLQGIFTRSNSDSRAKGEAATIFVSIISRMVLVPVVVLPLFLVLTWKDCIGIGEDPVFIVSVALLVSAPPALTLAQLTQAACGDAFERLITKTIFWSYCIFTPPLTIIYVVLGLWIAKF